MAIGLYGLHTQATFPLAVNMDTQIHRVAFAQQGQMTSPRQEIDQITFSSLSIQLCIQSSG
jgi:hypothetical protein